MIKNLLLITLCTLTISVFGQNSAARYIESTEIEELTENIYIDVRIHSFLFKKIDPNKGLVEFTSLDALKLEKYFMDKKGTLIVESIPINKTVKVMSRVSEAFDHRDIIGELETMGYFASGIRKSEESIFFKAKPPCERINTRIVKAGSASSGSDCNDCGEVKISQEVLDKFKDVEYGGTAIDFSLPNTNTNTVSDEKK